MNVQEIITNNYACFHIIESSRRAVAELSQIKDKLYYFNRLLVDEKIRNKGYAHKLLQAVIKWANQEKIIILLDINPYGDLNYNQLLKFYFKYGFTIKNKKHRTLIRNAQII